mmetsp:Transcript_15895/g.37994  ORF Transcript_15895/g.37994 Transcript_15895/m.37994 type:complete len:288 (-) Transcript_15895:104-967(-)
MLANGIADGGVVGIQSLQAVGRQVIEILVEEGHIFIGLPLSTVSPPQTIHTGGVDDLIVNTQREGDEGTGLDELAIPQLSLTDVLQKDFVQMIEAIGRGNGGNVDLLAAVVDAVFAIHLGTADPGDEADGKGDDVVELVLLLNLMNHPIEPSLTVDGTDEDLLLASVDERGKFLESIAVLVYGHAQEYDISIGDDVLVVIAEGVDISVEFLQNLMLHVLHLTSHSAIPLVRAERKEVDRVLGSTQERDENMRGVAVTDDGYGRLLAHDCDCSGCGCQDRNFDGTSCC